MEKMEQKKQECAKAENVAPAGEEKGKRRKIPWSMLYIVATIVAVLLFGLFNREFGNVFRTIANLTPGLFDPGCGGQLGVFPFRGGDFPAAAP